MRISDWSSDVCSSDLIVSARNEGAAKRVVHCSMIGDLVLDISLVERRTIKAVELAHLLLCLFGQRCACSICFRRDAELLHQCQRLIIYRGVVPDHLSSAKARTALFLDFARACLPAAMSICPAVYAMCAIWASFG